MSKACMHLFLLGVVLLVTTTPSLANQPNDNKPFLGEQHPSEDKPFPEEKSPNGHLLSEDVEREPVRFLNDEPYMSPFFGEKPPESKGEKPPHEHEPTRFLNDEQYMSPFFGEKLPKGKGEKPPHEHEPARFLNDEPYMSPFFGEKPPEPKPPIEQHRPSHRWLLGKDVEGIHKPLKFPSVMKPPKVKEEKPPHEHEPTRFLNDEPYMSPFFGEKPLEQKPPIEQHKPPHRWHLGKDVESTREPPKFPSVMKPPKVKGKKPPHEHEPARFLNDEPYMSPFFGEKPAEQKPPIEQHKPPHRWLLGKDVEGTREPPKFPSVMKPPKVKGEKPLHEHEPARFLNDEPYMSPFFGEKPPEQKPPIEKHKPSHRWLLGKDVEGTREPPKFPSVMKPPKVKGEKPLHEHEPARFLNDEPYMSPFFGEKPPEQKPPIEKHKPSHRWLLGKDVEGTREPPKFPSVMKPPKVKGEKPLHEHEPARFLNDEPYMSLFFGEKPLEQKASIEQHKPPHRRLLGEDIEGTREPPKFSSVIKPPKVKGKKPPHEHEPTQFPNDEPYMSPFFGEKPPEQKASIEQHKPPHRRLLGEDIEGTREPPKFSNVMKPPKVKGEKPQHEHEPTRFLSDEPYMSPFFGEKPPEQKQPIEQHKPPHRRLLGKDVEITHEHPKFSSVMKPPKVKGEKPPHKHEPSRFLTDEPYMSPFFAEKPPEQKTSIQQDKSPHKCLLGEVVEGTREPQKLLSVMKV